MERIPPTLVSAFADNGIERTVSEHMELVKSLYLSDTVPWVLAFSGGKDSTAMLQLVWRALAQLAPAQLHKDVHVICTDTLVENPIVARRIVRSLTAIGVTAQEQGLPFKSHRLTPELRDRYWVNVIGNGYPVPRPKMRWCTSRLKINPSNDFIKRVVGQYGVAVVVLGVRMDESASRAALRKRQEQDVRGWLKGHSPFEHTWIFAPIEDWTSDDVWLYLMHEKNPWGIDNQELRDLYQGVRANTAPPVVVDSSSPTCGDSRFSCFVCTMAPRDKLAETLMYDDPDNEWMSPLRDFRNSFFSVPIIDDRQHRELRRMDGRQTLTLDAALGEGSGDIGGVNRRHSAPMYGPYTRTYRQHLLRELLRTQRALQETAPPHWQLELLELEEMEAIRRIWVDEKQETEDSLPSIYEEVMGVPYPASGQTNS